MDKSCCARVEHYAAGKKGTDDLCERDSVISRPYCQWGGGSTKELRSYGTFCVIKKWDKIYTYLFVFAKQPQER